MRYRSQELRAAGRLGKGTISAQCRFFRQFHFPIVTHVEIRSPFGILSVDESRTTFCFEKIATSSIDWKQSSRSICRKYLFKNWEILQCSRRNQTRKGENQTLLVSINNSSDRGSWAKSTYNLHGIGPIEMALFCTPWFGEKARFSGEWISRENPGGRDWQQAGCSRYQIYQVREGEGSEPETSPCPSVLKQRTYQRRQHFPWRCPNGFRSGFLERECRVLTWLWDCKKSFPKSSYTLDSAIFVCAA